MINNYNNEMDKFFKRWEIDVSGYVKDVEIFSRNIK